MEAGRELDALVAEKVMGEKNDGTLEAWVPRYSLDIAAAWEALEKFTTEYRVAVSKNNGLWWCEIGSFDEYDEVNSVGCFADTAPLAICLAVLKAKGVQISNS